MSSRVCPTCATVLAYDVPSCLECGCGLESGNLAEAVVLAVTAVQTPSVGHEDVPYWTALVRDAQGLQSMVKFDHEVLPGDTVSLIPSHRDLAAVGVVGSGVMGRGLTEHLLARGHRVAWVARSADRLQAAADRVFDRLTRVLDEAQFDSARECLAFSTDYGLLDGVDVVIEAVAEDLATKLAVLRQIEAAVSDDTVIATNTSGLPLDDLAAVLRAPDRFGGLHFFNPVNRMRLVETVTCSQTNEGTSAFLDDFARSVGKVPVRVASAPAFVVNRVLMPLLNEAARTLEEGVASPESIDEAVRLGLNHPMGPLALADLIGLDVVTDIMNNLADRTGDESYRPRPALTRLIAEGKLGRKSGEGFYDYGVEIPPIA